MEVNYPKALAHTTPPEAIEGGLGCTGLSVPETLKAPALSPYADGGPPAFESARPSQSCVAAAGT